MVLVDTSVWIDHLRNDNARLRPLLEAAQVLVHPFVVGELALGRLKRRREVMALLSKMPQAEVASHAEVLGFVERRGLSGKGVGYVDAHLLAASSLAGAQLWTLDLRLRRVAHTLGVA